MCVLWPQWKHCLRQFLQVHIAGSPTWSLKHLPMKVFHLTMKVFPFPASWSCSVVVLQSRAADSGSGTSFIRPSGRRGQVTRVPLVCFGSGGQGHAMSPLQGLAGLSFLYELHCCRYERWKTPAPKNQVCPGLPSYSCLAQIQVCWADSSWLSSLLAWHLLLLIWLSLSTVLTRSALKTVFIKINSQIKQQRSVPCCLIFGPTQAKASLHWLTSKQSSILVSKLKKLIKQIGRLHKVK